MLTDEATTTELPGLLRGCLKWQNDRPHIDNAALLVVADWCEEHGRADEAEAIRGAMTWWQPRKGAKHHPDLALKCGDRHGLVCLVRRSNSSRARFRALWEGDIAQYELRHDEVEGTTTKSGGRGERILPGAMCRIRDLARWHCVCSMLGYPPLRLIGDH